MRAAKLEHPPLCQSFNESSADAVWTS